MYHLWERFKIHATFRKKNMNEENVFWQIKSFMGEYYRILFLENNKTRCQLYLSTARLSPMALMLAK